MKAISIEQNELRWVDHDKPHINDDEVLIRVRASAVNRADLLQRRGLYPVPAGASPILGLECAGEIQAVGELVERFKPGDAVCALLTGGGYAEFAAVPAGQVLPIPPGMSYEGAAAVPEVFATAYLNLYLEGRLKPGERVLLHAGASGVGTAAIQLCRTFENPCYVTVGSEEKLSRCLELGADGGCVRGAQEFVELQRGWTQGQGMDVILDPVGAGYLADNLKSLAIGGRLVVIGLMSGIETTVNLAPMLMKRLRVIGSTLRSQPIEAKSTLMAELEKRLWPLFENSTLSPVIESVFPIEEAEQAHKLMAGNQTVGKIVLWVGD